MTALAERARGARRAWRRLGGRCTLGAVGCLLVALAAGCTGSTGAQGPAGPAGSTGPAGPPGSSSLTALEVSTATSITATITSVTVPAAAPIQPVVKFTLVDQIGEPLKGLTASQISFAIGKLVPPGTQLTAIPPQTVAPTPQNSAQWQSYIYQIVNPAPTSAGTGTDPVTGTTPEPQASTESATAGSFVDNGDGTYQYTFHTDLSSVSGVTYDPTLVHRVGFEIRGVTNSTSGATVAANSPVYTFEPATGATSGFDDNAIVDDATCLQCHQQLAFHGGARTEVQYCVLCHNPSSFDPSTGNTIDFKVMFHKIHMGVHLPSVQAGGHYYIFGHGNSINDYSSIVFPTDTTNGPDTCTSCHNQSDTNTPDAADWQNVPSIEACGSCHDNVNFATGANHSAASLGNLTDNDCATCHGPDSNVEVAEGNDQYSIAVASAHTNLVERNKVLAYSQANFAYQIDSINLSGAQPTVTFTVSNPSSGQNWNILTDPPFTYCSPATTSMAAVPSWPTTDYTNASPSGFVSSEAQPTSTTLTCQSPASAPTPNADGSFTATLPALPTGLSGSLAVSIQGFPAYDFGDGLGPQELIVPSVVGYAAITGGTALARRTVVDVAKCDNCHQVLVAHGNHRVDDVQVCVQCHNPDATDLAARQSLGVNASNAADGQNEQPLDFKYMIHALHDGNVRAAAGAPYVIYNAHLPSPYYDDWIDITPFPGALNNCLGCHEAGTYYPQDPTSSTSLGTTIVSLNSATGKPFTTPAGETAITPDTAVCSACHVASTDIEHMQQNGGSFTAMKDASSQIVGGNQETCVLCHGPGATADVGVVHNISAYQE
ncbi:MAG TPA: OmcA/MtrC family decaheme c-type cytochrome [Steroidobacteraceae bacterium]|nr:OmcA/MtrC family decaheme c-type cytochrome [Steroidobacteraceae bacterium]